MEPLLLSTLLGAVGQVIDRILPQDPEKAAAAKLELIKMQQAGEFKSLDTVVQLAQGQTDTNKAEAASGNAYAAGWRPTIGYILAAGLAYQYLARPLLIGLGGYSALPALDGSLIEMVMGMLGLAGLRTFEKIKGAAK
jgi:hypothetical protein